MLISMRTSSPSQGANPKARILTLGSYPPTLKTWHLLLEAQGYQAVSFVPKNGGGDLKNGFGDLFKQGRFDVIILGRSVDDAEKKSLVEAFRQCSSAPIISVPCKADEPTDGADIHAEPDPEELLRLIANLIQGQKSRALATISHR